MPPPRTVLPKHRRAYGLPSIYRLDRFRLTHSIDWSQIGFAMAESAPTDVPVTLVKDTAHPTKPNLISSVSLEGSRAFPNNE
jgi:hypothetical protein